MFWNIGDLVGLWADESIRGNMKILDAPRRKASSVIGTTGRLTLQNSWSTFFCQWDTIDANLGCRISSFWMRREPFLERLWKDFDGEIFDDFEVCPMTSGRSYAMRMAILKSAPKVVHRRRSNCKAKPLNC
jgi:hypothetical protein